MGEIRRFYEQDEPLPSKAKKMSKWKKNGIYNFNGKNNKIQNENSEHVNKPVQEKNQTNSSPLRIAIENNVKTNRSNLSTEDLNDRIEKMFQDAQKHPESFHEMYRVIKGINGYNLIMRKRTMGGAPINDDPYFGYYALNNGNYPPEALPAAAAANEVPAAQQGDGQQGLRLYYYDQQRGYYEDRNPQGPAQGQRYWRDLQGRYHYYNENQGQEQGDGQQGLRLYYYDQQRGYYEDRNPQGPAQGQRYWRDLQGRYHYYNEVRQLHDYEYELSPEEIPAYIQARCTAKRTNTRFSAGEFLWSNGIENKSAVKIRAEHLAYVEQALDGCEASIKTKIDIRNNIEKQHLI